MPTTRTERAVTSQVESPALQTNTTASLGQAANTHGQATLDLPAGPIPTARQVLNVPNTHFEEDYDPLYAHSLGPNFNVLEGATSKIHFEVLFRAGIIRKGDVLTMKIEFLRNERWENGEARLLVDTFTHEDGRFFPNFNFSIHQTWPDGRVTSFNRGLTLLACRGPDHIVKYLKEQNVSGPEVSSVKISKAMCVRRQFMNLGTLYYVKQAYDYWLKHCQEILAHGLDEEEEESDNETVHGAGDELEGLDDGQLPVISLPDIEYAVRVERELEMRTVEVNRVETESEFPESGYASDVEAGLEMETQEEEEEEEETEMETEQETEKETEKQTEVDTETDWHTTYATDGDTEVYPGGETLAPVDSPPAISPDSSECI